MIGLLLKVGVPLALSAVIAWGVGYTVGQARGLREDVYQAGDTNGYNRALATFAEQQATLKNELEEAARQREAEIKARLAQAQEEAAAANRRADTALQDRIINDPEFAQCAAYPYPNSIRRHLPPFLRLETETNSTTNSNNS